jgi:BolA-like protein 3
MLCQRCRRVATLAVRQLKSSPAASSRAQSTLALGRSSWAATATPQASARRYPTAGTTLLRYSTAASETAAAKQGSSNQPALPEKPDFLDDAESGIWDKLAAEFAPTELTVQDISGGCGSMYGIEITSEKFRGANMLKQQRMVNAVLGDQMKQWHGVQLRTKVPS